MSKPLEPTKEQIWACVEAQLAQWGPDDDGPVPDGYGRNARILWPLIRDMVLEEAARACEKQLEAGFCADPEAKDWIQSCIEDIRDMKGNP